MWLNAKQLQPEPEMGLYAEECLIKGDVGCDVKNGVWGHMVELYPIETWQAPKKGVKRKTKSSDEVGDKHHTPSLARCWNDGG